LSPPDRHVQLTGGDKPRPYDGTLRLPTLQYFAELPFRLLSAELVAYGGERWFETRVYDLARFSHKPSTAAA